jgi:cysteine desulfurase
MKEPARRLSIYAKAIKMIYFDNAATAPSLKEARALYDKISDEHFGNPSSNHGYGFEAAKILEESRLSLLTSFGVEKTHDVVFTSGATEANNLALKGVAFRYANRGKKIITSVVEHRSVLAPLEQLRDLFGYELVILPVNASGYVEPSVLAKALDEKTILVSLMAVNNETGTIFPVKSLADCVHKYPKAFFHVDCTQAVGKAPIPYGDCDLFSFSGHKFGAPKGTGALVYKKNIQFVSLLSGGEQEKGFRAGTVNVAGNASLSLAASFALKNREEHLAKVQPLYDRLRSYLASRDDIVINSPQDGSPYVLSFSLLKKKASVVVQALSNENIYVSSVSACSSKVARFSYVVAALGRPHPLAINAIRVSFSYENTLEEVETFISAFNRIMQEVSDDAR